VARGPRPIRCVHLPVPIYIYIVYLRVRVYCGAHSCMRVKQCASISFLVAAAVTDAAVEPAENIIIV